MRVKRCARWPQCPGVQFPNGLQYGLLAAGSRNVFFDLHMLYGWNDLEASGNTSTAIHKQWTENISEDEEHGLPALCSADDVLRARRGFNAHMEGVELCCSHCGNAPSTILIDCIRAGPLGRSFEKAAELFPPEKAAVPTPGFSDPADHFVLLSDAGRGASQEFADLLKELKARKELKGKIEIMEQLKAACGRLKASTTCPAADKAILQPLFDAVSCADSNIANAKLVPLLGSLSKKSPPACVFNQPSSSAALLARLQASIALSSPLTPADLTAIGDLMPALQMAINSQATVHSCFLPLLTRLAALVQAQLLRAERASLELPPGVDEVTRTWEEGECVSVAAIMQCNSISPGSFCSPFFSIADLAESCQQESRACRPQVWSPRARGAGTAVGRLPTQLRARVR